MSPTLAVIRPERWSVCLIDSEARPARVKRVVVVARTGEDAKTAADHREVAEGTNYRAVAVEAVPWTEAKS